MHADGSFTAVYDLTTTGPEGGTVAALAGGYHVRFGETAETAHSWARVAGKLAVQAVDCFTEWNTLRLEGRSSGAVAITASPPWSPRERTKYGRAALRKIHWGPVQPGILFESYNGKRTNDNPRALFDAVIGIDDSIPLYWSVRDRTVEVPPGGIPVVEGTMEWHRALATTRVWVNNNNFPYYVRKRPGQFYLQTWHGTPIKKLLLDMSRRKVPLTYRRLMRTEVCQWDLLLAQSEQAANSLRTSLGYEGDVFVGEQPRNVRLLRGLHRKDEIRKLLGLGVDERVILYVPTWRASDRNGRPLRWRELLDPLKLSEATEARVLVRAHHVAKPEQEDLRGARDVSNYPHVEDLMAVANVLITDYSSIVYDFDLTGGMVVHFVPDRRSYGKERGLYRDWAQGRNVAENFPELLQFVVDGFAGIRRAPESSPQWPAMDELSRIVLAHALTPEDAIEPANGETGA